MKENRDPAIKLFGKKIPLLVDNETPVSSGDSEPSMASNSLDGEKSNKEEDEEEEVKDSPAGKASECMEEDDSTPANTEEDFRTPETLPESNATPKTPSINEENENPKTLKTQKEQDDTEEKILKKPDKILPCPRCNSMDTKFCYYNNYNINQPRHFCKSCQRYWTAGGTMRNVPVGAGRRKNKNPASHYQHITISEALQAARLDAPNGIHHPTLKSNNGRVLSFGMNVPVCDSMAASVLNLADKRVLNGTRNKFHKFEGQGIPVPSRSGENGDDCSGGSSMTLSNSTEQGGRNGPQEPLMHNINSFPSQIPCLPGVPWPCPWNSSVPPPVFCPPGFPMPIYPAAYWNCGGMPGTWNIPLLPPQSPSPNQMASSGPNSPLGKHSRDREVLKPDNSEEEEPSKQKNGRVLVPKTLRIDDPTEAAKSSIWATLGIKNESPSKGGWFKALQSKGNEKNHISETSKMLQANPAALSRSLNFHEVS